MANLDRPRPGRTVFLPLAAVLTVLLLTAPAVDARPATPGDPLPLGTLSLDGRRDPGCPGDFECMGFKVVCPGLRSPASGFMALSSPDGPPRGVVVFFSGTTGRGYWSGASRLTPPFMNLLRLDGFLLVQVRWTEGWLISARGEEVGPALLACRPATAVQWIHDNLYAPLRIDPGVGECGFCLTGQSGGGDQAMYALASYGLDGIVDAVVPSSSPTHSALAQGCLGAPGLAYATSDAQLIDDSYGFIGSLEWQGPCVNADPSFTPEWRRDALDTGGTDFVYDTTRIHFIEGRLDDSGAPQHAIVFYDLLVRNGSPYLTFEPIGDMSHAITESQDGLDALRKALLGGA